MFGNNRVHANFSVDDMEAAREFYVDKLGFKVAQDKGLYLVLEAGEGTMVNIYKKDNHQPWDSTVLGIEVEDVRQALNQLAEVGVRAEQVEGTDESGVISDPEMGTIAWFRDPADNWVCLSSQSSA